MVDRSDSTHEPPEPTQKPAHALSDRQTKVPDVPSSSSPATVGASHGQFQRNKCATADKLHIQ